MNHMTAQTNSMRGFILEFEFEDLFWRFNMKIQFEDSIYTYKMFVSHNVTVG